VVISPKLIGAKEIDGPYDLVLLSVKAYALEAAMDDFAPAVGPETVILPVLNGMRHIDLLTQRFGEGAVLGGVCLVATEIDGSLPANSARVRGPVLDRRRLSRIPLSIAVAGGVSVSTLRMQQGLDGARHLVPVFELRLSDLSDGRHRVPGHSEASLHLVSGDVVCDQPEERRQRTGLATGPRTG
jgi:hypothetical protein